MSPHAASVLITNNSVKRLRRGIAEGVFDPLGTDEAGQPWLVVAIEAKAWMSARTLLEWGASPHVPPPHKPPILEAAAHSLSTTLALIDAGADPNTNYRGWTPLKKALGTGKESIVTVLLAFGASPSIGDSQPGHAHLMELAVRKCSAPIVERLIGLGGDWRQPTTKGDPLLALAMVCGDRALAEVLLAAGASPLDVTSKGQSLAECARAHPALAEWMHRLTTEAALRAGLPAAQKGSPAPRI